MKEFYRFNSRFELCGRSVFLQEHGFVKSLHFLLVGSPYLARSADIHLKRLSSRDFNEFHRSVIDRDTSIIPRNNLSADIGSWVTQENVSVLNSLPLK